MRVLFELTHPAHVHLFRNSIRELNATGHDTLVTSRRKDVTVDLLDQYGVSHRVISTKESGFPRAAGEWAIRTARLLDVSRRFEPDVVVSRFNPAAATVATVLGSECLLFDDTEHKPEPLRRLTYPLADQVYTPTSFARELGTNQVRYEGYHELAYLHPNRFDPDPTVLENVGVERTEPLVVLRLVSWLAPHDVGQSGIDHVEEFVRRLEDAGATVLISAESGVPDRLEGNRVTVSPHRIHDLLYYADLFVGESGTMTIESAVLGTPAIFVSSIRLGVIDELEDEYELVFGYRDEARHRRGLEKALEILRREEKNIWNRRRERLLEEKIDTTRFILEEIRGVHGKGQPTDPRVPDVE